eukprot:866175-Pelagomonas_calceolata.AAC.2
MRGRAIEPWLMCAIYGAINITLSVCDTSKKLSVKLEHNTSMEESSDSKNAFLPLWCDTKGEGEGGAHEMLLSLVSLPLGLISTECPCQHGESSGTEGQQ